MDDHLSGTSLVTSDNGTSLGNMKYYPFGVCRNSPENFPTDRLFTGQRLDNTGLYYYGARYYDATMGRFISADTIIPDPANPQSFNRYSYCLNNPLKYVDPSGHDVEINYWNVEVIDVILQFGYYLPPEIWQALNEVINSPEYQAYADLRDIAPELTGSLEAAEETMYIERGDTRGHIAVYNDTTNTITLSQEYKKSNKSILTLAHEARHGWQDIVARDNANSLPISAFDRKKWNDRLYREWDAYKYAGDLDDRLGWHVHWLPFNTSCYMQSFNLDTSYTDYKKAGARYYSFLLGAGYIYKNFPDAHTLTQEDYYGR